jgi:hypothetical protein
VKRIVTVSDSLFIGNRWHFSERLAGGEVVEFNATVPVGTQDQALCARLLLSKDVRRFLEERAR